MELRRLVLADESAFLNALRGWPEADREWLSWHWQPGVSFADVIDKMNRESSGEGLPQHLVPATMYYGFVDGVIVGRLHLRHYLNSALSIRGGHIGYAVNPDQRGKGYAKAMLKLGLERASELGITEAMMTCSESNTASWKVIESVIAIYGGKLEDTFLDQNANELVRKYRVATKIGQGPTVRR